MRKKYLLIIRHGRHMVDTCRFGYIANRKLKILHLGSTSLTQVHFFKSSETNGRISCQYTSLCHDSS